MINDTTGNYVIIIIQIITQHTHSHTHTKKTIFYFNELTQKITKT